MAVFNTNQNRQLYVATEFTSDTPASLGQIAMGVTSDNKQFWFKHYGQGGLTRSDLITSGSVEYAKVTSADKLRYYLRTATIALNTNINDGDIVAGQDYVVRINIYNYLAPGDTNKTTKYGSVHGFSGMTTTEFYEALAANLTANFSKEVAPLLTFTASSSGVTVTEVEQPWVPGTLAREHVHFDVSCAPILYEGDDVLWMLPAPVTASSVYLGNGKDIADLEIFCHGERGDQYRGIGWPNVIPTRYEVDPDKEYYVLDIHYWFSDTGVNVHKSEKDITIVSTDSAVLESITSAMSGYGVTITE